MTLKEHSKRMTDSVQGAKAVTESLLPESSLNSLWSRVGDNTGLASR